MTPLGGVPLRGLLLVAEVALATLLLAGVRSAVATDHLPLTDYSIIATVRVEGRLPPRRGEDAAASIANVSPAYFEAMRIPLVEGRGFTATDAAGGSVIVNQAFARSFFEGEDPIGGGS